jgi:hypothetical protein
MKIMIVDEQPFLKIINEGDSPPAAERLTRHGIATARETT